MDFDIMNLQVEAPKTDIDDYTWTIYGDAGIGKTSLCAYLYDDPAFFQWEQGQNTLWGKKVPVDSWKTFKKYIKTLTKAYNEGKAMPMRTAIMDTVDFAWKKCVDYVCTMRGWEHPSDGDWGKGWDAVSTEWEMEMANLENIGIKPIFISHSKEKEFKPKKSEKYDMIIPSVPSGCLATIVDKVDFVVYCTYEKIEVEKGVFNQVRRAYFRNSGDFRAKSHLAYMPDFIEFGDTPEDTAEIIKNAFNEAAEKEFSEKAKGRKAPKQTKAKSEKKEAEKKEAEKKEVEKKTSPTPPKEEAKIIESENAAMIEAESEPKTEALESEIELTLAEARTRVYDFLIEQMRAKKITVVGINDLVQEHCGVGKIADIDDLSKAVKLYEVAQEMFI